MGFQENVKKHCKRQLLKLDTSHGSLTMEVLEKLKLSTILTVSLADLLAKCYHFFGCPMQTMTLH